MNVRTAQSAFPMFRSMRADVADNRGTASRTNAEGYRETIQRALRQAEGLQPFAGEGDVHRESGPVLLLSSIDVLEHVAQPCARFGTVGELHENVSPIAHENGRHDVVLNVVQIVLEVSRAQGLCRT